MSDDMPEVARLLGRQLGLGLIQNEQKNAGVTLRYATVDAVHSDGGVYTADLTVAGGELHAVPMTTDCVNLQPGDRCIVETANHLSIITGVLARPGAWVPVTQPQRETAKFKFQDTGSFQGVVYGGGNTIIIDYTLRLLYLDLQSFYSTVSLGSDFNVWLYQSGPKPSKEILLGSIANVSGNRYGKQARWSTDGRIFLVGGLGNGDNIHITPKTIPIPEGVTFA